VRSVEPLHEMPGKRFHRCLCGGLRKQSMKSSSVLWVNV
jgi:hypothetical protein